MAPNKSLKELAKPSENPTMLGDPVSLKAEKSSNSPTEHDQGAASSSSHLANDREHVKNPAPTEEDVSSTSAKESRQDGQQQGASLKQLKEVSSTEGDTDTGDAKRKSLKELAEQNPTRLGDPVSLKAETSNTSPTENDRGAGGSNKRDSKL